MVNIIPNQAEKPLSKNRIMPCIASQVLTE